MIVEVVDREQIERGVPVRGSYVVITIADPGMPQASVKRQSGLLDVLPLYFHDAEPWSGNPSTIRLMDEDDAKAIYELVHQWKDTADALVVNCIAGMSRSPGVAIGVCRAMGWPHQHIIENSQPNAYVLRLVQEVFENAEN